MPREFELTGGRIEQRGGALAAVTVVGAVGERVYDLDIFAVWGARWP